MDHLDDVRGWTYQRPDEKYGPVANAAVWVLLVLLISAPWLIGIVWIAVYLSSMVR